MKIGCTLPLGYLNGRLDDDLDQLWSDMYGPVEECLVSLKSSGVTSVEVRNVPEGTTTEQIERAVDKINMHGLQTTIHLWLPRFADDNELPEEIIGVDQVLRQLGAATGTIPAAMHGHRVREYSTYSEAVEQTITDFREVSQRLVELQSPITPAFEICRQTDGGPVGVTYQQVADIADEVGAPNLGFCWDTGHCWSNHLNYGSQAFPPSSYLSKVTHTHIHDLGPGGRTHGPLGFADTPIVEYVAALVESGYSGIYHLELYPTRWLQSPTECREAVENSIQALQEAIKSARAA